MVSQGLIFSKNPVYEKCPSCHSLGTLRKSHSRKTSEKLIKKLTIFAPYRCKKCSWRGYQAKLVLTSKALKNGITYLFMIAFAAFIIYEILKRFI